ncbi:hypothetical protein [Streptomyces cavernicola]|uniref:Uncharacterized protein n=1 Tax=Streptomyces cavernicola TaxID=3043613 RepID=A0ABT6SA14_9ACTN|nr:hypothetical protein [Streptomyces sp. B-S-A6]MDI3405027.1 hypothetical protein [Streptomyces sp. B-S-A6]
MLDLFREVVLMVAGEAQDRDSVPVWNLAGQFGLLGPGNEFPQQLEQQIGMLEDGRHSSPVALRDRPTP